MPSISAEKIHDKKINDMKNYLNDPEAIHYCKITPWQHLEESEYLESCSALEPQVISRALEKIEKNGLCLIRLANHASNKEDFESMLEDSFGSLYESQNKFPGKVKKISPDPEADVAATTGDSPKDLPLHVDGTQTENTPPILAFQYVAGPKMGGYSTFLDLSYVLSQFNYEELDEILSVLSKKDCATFYKKNKFYLEGKETVVELKYSGPIFTTECYAHSLSCRVNFGSIMTVKDEYLEQFNKFRDAVKNVEVFSIKPMEGDIIIFDNWRLLHGRKSIAGHHNRHHYRSWINELNRSNRRNYRIGIRPVHTYLTAKIHEQSIK
jgi:alpha-ketoglutarate-dependent taurine dioxygenase